jgi:hypothetical protein
MSAAHRPFVAIKRGMALLARRQQGSQIRGTPSSGVPSALFVVARRASDLHQSLAFLVGEAMAAGLPAWAVGGRSALGTPQDDLRAAIWASQIRSHQRKVPRWLERAPPASSPPRELPLSMELPSSMVGSARSYSVSSPFLESRYSICPCQVVQRHEHLHGWGLDRGVASDGVASDGGASDSRQLPARARRRVDCRSPKGGHCYSASAVISAGLMISTSRAIGTK